MQAEDAMFSGIITDIAKITKINKDQLDWKVHMDYSQEIFDLSIGDSISCNGICLTVVEIEKNNFAVDISEATRDVSNVKHWHVGSNINLEGSLEVGGKIHGHFVLGHVDSCSQITDIINLNGSYNIKVKIPDKLKKYFIKKGSAAINGVSLTINNVKKNILDFNIIPHTWKNTNFSKIKVDDFVNIEADYLAKIILDAKKY